MKTELQKKLLEKYSHFFQTDLKIYIGEKSMNEEVHELLNQEEIVLPIQFGFECGNGWYMLLDELMAEIDNHLKNVNRWREKGEHKYKFLKNLSHELRIRSAHKQKMRKKLGEWIEKRAPRVHLPFLTVNIDQIKEKFGGLRFYYSGGDDFIFGAVSLAENMSYKICECCGTTKNIGQTKGWITTLCKECAEKNKNIIWEANNEY